MTPQEFVDCWVAYGVEAVITAVEVWWVGTPEFAHLLLRAMFLLVLANVVVAIAYALKRREFESRKVTDTLGKLAFYMAAWLFGIALDPIVAKLFGLGGVGSIFCLSIVCIREASSLVGKLQESGIDLSQLLESMQFLLLGKLRELLPGPKERHEDK